MKSAAAIVGVMMLASCSRDEMADVPHYEPMEQSPLFPDGTSARMPPAGTVERDRPDIEITSGRRPGDPAPLASSPLPFTSARLVRGQELFNIHCAVCHGEDGYGAGIVVRRGFPAPPSYHTDRLRQAPDGHFFDVISSGYGKMAPYRSRVAAGDRWAIIGYIRALQRGQNATLSDVTDSKALEKLKAERSGP